MKVKWLITGNIIYVLLQWAIISVLTKFYSTEEVGNYFFNLSIAAPIFLFFSLKLPNLAVTLNNNQSDHHNLIYTRIISSILSILFTIFIGLIFFKEYLNLYILIAVILFKFFEHFDDLFAAFYQKELNFRKIFEIKVKRGLIYFLAVIFSCEIFKELDIALIIATFFYSVIWIIINKNNLVFTHFDKATIKRYFYIGFPLGASVAISSLVVNGTRVFIGTKVGALGLAIFGTIGYTTTAFTLLINVIGQYYLPIFSKTKKKKQLFYKNIVISQLIIFSVGLIGIILSYFFGYSILKLAYNSSIAEYYQYLTLIIVSTLFKASSALLGTSITATQKYSFQLKFSIFAAAMTFIFLPYFIDSYKLGGAFITLLLVNILEWIGYIIFSLAYYRRYFSEYSNENL